MELDFTALNQLREEKEPTPGETHTPKKTRSGEYKDTTRAETLLQALKAALNEEPETAAFPEMDLSHYPETARQQIRALMITQYIADNVGSMDTLRIISHQAKALSLLLEEDYTGKLIEALRKQ